LAAADPVTQPAAESGRLPRLPAIDCLRGVALVAMVVYHTAFDLYADRLISTDIFSDLGWETLARATASTFLALAGVGMVLSTRGGFRPKRYLRRLGLIAGGAAAVSLATWWFDPATFVFFGILHEIVVASVLALPFLWLPAALTAAAGAGVIALPFFFSSPVFDAPALWWVGLSTIPPVTVDYVPIFPWFGVVLIGIVIGRLVVRYQAVIATFQPRNLLVRALAFGGRHTLPIYLIHQPLIIGALSLAVAVLPPPSKEALRSRVVGQWTAACVAQGATASICTALAGCMFDRLYGTDLFAMKSVADMTPEQRARWNALIDACQPAQ
jgi:uncharacterized membrane protein